MYMSNKAILKAYTQGYYTGYQNARADMENGINRLNIESDLLSHPIEMMGLCVRTFNSLDRAGLHYIGELTDLPHIRINAIRGLGAKDRLEIARWLEDNGIGNTVWNAFL